MIKTDPGARVVAWLFMLPVAGAALAASVTVEQKGLTNITSPGVTVVSPVAGSTYQPGATVPVELTVDPLLQGTNVLVTSTGFKGIGIINMTGPPFTGSLTIPNDLSGPVTLMFMVQDATVASVGGAEFNINIVPTEAPVELEASDKWVRLNIPMTKPELSRTLSVSGTYADGTTRDLSDAVTGTTYSSANPAIATVTANGVVSAVAAGTTYIVIDNQGVKTYAEAIVKDPLVSEVPVEHTAQVDFAARGFRRDPESGRYVQQVVITNNGSLPISRPLVLVVTDLPAGVKLANAFGNTQVITPLGSAYAATDSIESSFVSPGKTASATLEFLNFQGVPITYTPRLFTAVDP